MKRLTLLVTAFFLAIPMIAAAQLGDDEIRAEVVSVDTNQNQLQVRVLESGNPDLAPPGELQTLMVRDDVSIEYEMESVFYALQDYTLRDLEQGARLVIEFEDVEGMRHATRIKGDPANEDMRRQAERLSQAKSGA